MTTTQIFTKYFAPLAPSMRRIAIKLTGNVADAEDLVADTQLRIWKAIDRYDPERATPSAWAFTIMRNAHLNDVGRRSRRVAVEHRWAKSEVTDFEKLEGRIDDARARELIDSTVREAIDDLPETWRDATLRAMKGQRHADIAEVQGTTRNTIHGRTSRSRIALRKKLAHARPLLEAVA